MATPFGICDFCYDNVLRSNDAWAYHHPSQSSLATSAQRGCAFCTLMFQDIKNHYQALSNCGLRDVDLRRWLHEDVAKVDRLPPGFGSSISLYRWSVRSLGRTRDHNRTVVVTFRVVPKRVQQSKVTQELETFDLPERAFYCFPEAELHSPSNAVVLGESTDPSVNGGQQIKSWIKICSTEHKQCPKRTASVSSFIPTRLLHIGGKRAGDSIRVVNASLNNIKGPYVTLSHCWGQAPIVTLRSSTLEEFMFAGVPWRNLSLNFQQAIETAWFLDVDYIWIDSLCIMQGDSEDWKREGSRMEQVYRNSYCNIAAADAEDSTGGLFRTREPREVLPPCFEISEGSRMFGRQKWKVLREDLWQNGLLSKPLYTRGWVYQERMLSPRILHFSQDQLFWDCTGMSACETTPTGLPLPLDEQSATERHWRTRLQGSTRGTKMLSGFSGDALEDLWTSSVKTYTGLKLTNQSDKRMAIWGVAKRIRDMINEEYVVGMWEGAIEEQLGWKVTDCTVAERPQDLKHIPTWSWTSMKGTIQLRDRYEQRRRSWVVKDHAGGRLTIDIGEFSTRLSMYKDPSESADDMRRKLQLAMEKRHRSRVPLRQHSYSSPVMSVLTVQTNCAAAKSSECSPERIVSNLSSSKVKEPIRSISPGSRGKEPELWSKRIAIQGCLLKGKLERNASTESWSFKILNIIDGSTDIIAFPDIEPSSDDLLMTFTVLALTMRPDWKSEDNEYGKTWYDGHGLMLQESGGELCFRRIGALEIRYLSISLWQDILTTSTLPVDTESVPTIGSYAKFFLE